MIELKLAALALEEKKEFHVLKHHIDTSMVKVERLLCAYEWLQSFIALPAIQITENDKVYSSNALLIQAYHFPDFTIYFNTYVGVFLSNQDIEVNGVWNPSVDIYYNRKSEYGDGEVSLNLGMSLLDYLVLKGQSIEPNEFEWNNLKEAFKGKLYTLLDIRPSDLLPTLDTLERMPELIPS